MRARVQLREHATHAPSATTVGPAESREKVGRFPLLALSSLWGEKGRVL